MTRFKIMCALNTFKKYILCFYLYISWSIKKKQLTSDMSDSVVRYPTNGPNRQNHVNLDCAQRSANRSLINAFFNLKTMLHYKLSEDVLLHRKINYWFHSLHRDQ